MYYRIGFVYGIFQFQSHAGGLLCGGGIIRGNDYFIAVGDTRIEAYDRVAVFALPSAVKEVDRLFR